MKKIVLVFLVAVITLGGLGGSVSAQTISGINVSSITHGDSITVSGGEFGVKNPAAPLIWDDCETATVEDYDAVTGSGTSAVRNDGGIGWDYAGPNYNSANYPPYPTWARISYQNTLYRDVLAPHNYSNKYLAGTHYTYPDNYPQYIGGTHESFSGVSFTVDSGFYYDDWFAIWYYRIHPDWISPCPPNNNHKFCVSNTGPDAYSEPGEFSYDAVNSPAPCSPDENPVAIRTHNGGCGETGEYTANPRLGWVHYERKQSTTVEGGFRNVFINNVESNYVTDCGVWQQPRSFTLGGYYRWAPDLGDTSTYTGRSGGTVENPENYATRYFDDIYVDTTLSRVMLGNNQSYSEATIVEPQIPSAWSNNSINVTVNLGKLNGSTAYLFVFDADNNHNEFGYPITLSEGGHKADLNDDGSISMPELIAFIARWKANDDVTKAEVEEARGIWFSGGVY